MKTCAQNHDPCWYDEQYCYGCPACMAERRAERLQITVQELKNEIDHLKDEAVAHGTK